VLIVLAHGGNKTCIQNFDQKISTKDELGDLDVGFWIVLNWLIKK
jgi:hypothetical protein